jgi:predicted transposase YbfD/YdcC
VLAQTKPKEVGMESNTQNGLVFEIGSLYAHFRTLSDGRKRKGLRYELALLLLLIVLAKMCGEDRPSGIAEWAKHRAGMLGEMLRLKRKGMPHHSTYRRILGEVVCVEELERVNQDFLSGKRFFGKQVLVSIDGKVLRGTLDVQQRGTYLLAAYLPREGIVLMEVAYAGKGYEPQAAPQVLKSMDLREKVIMGDALHTQREVSSQIVEAGGEYIWFAKGNQPKLEEDIRLWFEPDVRPIPGMNFPPKDLESARTTSKGHGRLERRTLTVSSQLKDFLNWPYLEQVFKLERHSISLKTGEIRDQTVYGLTSLAREEIAPAELLAMLRSYWGIENGLHYRRDVTLLEDQTRMTKGHMGQAMACINNLVLGILLAKKKCRYLPTARRYFSAHPSEALALITGL